MHAFLPFPSAPPTIAAAELRQNLNLKMGKKLAPKRHATRSLAGGGTHKKTRRLVSPPRVSLLPPPQKKNFRKGGRKIFPYWTYPTRNKIFLSRVGAISALAQGGPPTPTPKQTTTTKIVRETGLFSVVLALGRPLPPPPFLLRFSRPAAARSLQWPTSALRNAKRRQHPTIVAEEEEESLFSKRAAVLSDHPLFNGGDFFRRRRPRPPSHGMVVNGGRRRRLNSARGGNFLWSDDCLAYLVKSREEPWLSGWCQVWKFRPILEVLLPYKFLCNHSRGASIGHDFSERTLPFSHRSEKRRGGNAPN